MYSIKINLNKHLINLIFFAASLFLVTEVSVAQIEPEWIQHYDVGNQRLNDNIWDIYACVDGGYAFCGQSEADSSESIWVSKINADGDVDWSRLYGDLISFGIIQDDDGGFVIAGTTRMNGTTDIAVVRTEADGDLLWKHAFGTNHSEGGQAVIELKSGEFMVCGSFFNEQNNSTDGCLLLLDGGGELLWLETYGRENSQTLTALRETEGGVVASGYEHFGRNTSHYIIKVDFDGELIWERYIQSGEGEEINQSSMTACHVGVGFAITGRMWLNRQVSRPFLLRINDQGNVLWSRLYDVDPGNPPYGNCGAYTVVEQQDGGLIMACNGTGGCEALLIRTDGQGNEVWRFAENFGDDNYNCRFRSLVVLDNGEITAAGIGSYNETSVDGLVVKFHAENLPRLIYSYAPERLQLNSLPGDSITFVVRAQPIVDDELTYRWTLGEDTLSTDTTVTVVFDELGDYAVECLVTNGGFADSVLWSVHVSDFFIDHFTPENRELTIRRNADIDFTLDVVAPGEPDIDYQWTIVDRNLGRHDIEGEDSVRVRFDMTGDQQVEARVSRGEAEENVAWSIDVRSVIWYWWPHELELSVEVDSTFDFEITPFNRESDSLQYFWFLNDVDLGENEAAIWIDFREVGLQVVTAIVVEGQDADTVRWAVDVREVEFTADEADIADVPTDIVLYPPCPNPFNSTTQVSFYLTRDGFIGLSVYDINGHVVKTLVKNEFERGHHDVFFNAENIPSGLYFLSLKGDQFTLLRRIVIIR